MTSPGTPVLEALWACGQGMMRRDRLNRWASGTLVLLTLLRPAFAHALASALDDANGATGNAHLWQSLTTPPGEDYGTALAHIESFHLTIGFEPGLTFVHDGITDSFHANGALALAYHRQHEEPGYGYALRLDSGVLTMALANDADVNVGGSSQLGVGVSVAEAQWRQYLGADKPPVFMAVWGGLYGAGISTVRVAGAALSPFALPVSLAVGPGWGRMLPVTARVAVAEIESILLRDGVIDVGLPAASAERIVRMWVAAKNELGYADRAILLMKILQEDGIVAAPLTPATAYRLERVVAKLVSYAVQPRYAGSEALLDLRVARSWYGAAQADTPWTLAVEARAQTVWNLSYTADLWVTPAAAWAPRSVDWSGNTLPGNRRVSLLSANTTAAAAAFPNGEVVVDVPVRYTQIVLDSFYNTVGQIVLDAGLAAAFMPQVPTAPLGAAITLGGAYTFFFTAANGVKVGVNAGVGYLYGDVQPSIQLVAAYVGGTGSSFYVAPQAVPLIAPPSTTGERPYLP